MSEATGEQGRPQGYGAFMQAPEMLCVVDAERRFVAVNEEWTQHLGFTSDELRGQPVAEHLHPDDREAALAALDAVLRGERVPRSERRFRGKDGRYRRLQWNAWRDPAEPRLFAIARDVTAERSDLARFKALADNAPFFVGFAALAGEVLYINRAGMELLGYPGRDPRTIDVWMGLSPEMVERYKAERIPALLEHGSWMGETVFTQPDGTQIPVHQTLILLRDDAGEPDVMATIVYDLREARKQQAALRSFKALIEATPDFVGLASREGRTVYINQGGMRLLGREGQDFRAIALSDALTPASLKLLEEEVIPALDRDGIWSGETEFARADGGVVPVARVTVALRDDAGQRTGLATWAHDLRDRKRLEQALRDVIRSMSTPIIQVWEGVLALPVIGVVDSARAADMTQALLDAIARQGCRVAVLDLTGVEMIDTSTLDHIFRMVRAASLLGSRCVISGISAAAAHAITHLQADLTDLETFRSLREALVFAIRESRAR